MQSPVLSLILAAFAQSDVDPPAPLEPVPSAEQLAWHQLEYYAFVHFNMNTFTDREWGDGQESAAVFQPSELDCRQWARVCKEAGMAGIILTAKHHDGFCLWPSSYTEHDVASSPWRSGEGDVLEDLAAACAEYGLRFGLYLSPWDRNNALYGDSPRYNEYFKKQLTEVLTGYGPVFEVWFDGACGEGPNGKRQVYDWDGFIETVRRHQPQAVIFSDAGPDVRWVGNERGYAGETNWSTLRRDEFYPGCPNYAELTEGHEGGTHWLPAECNTSIRPGWYYHPSEDDRVKSLGELLDVYYGSIGRNANLLLNLPVDRRGLVHENDVERLLELRAVIDATFDDDLAKDGRATADSVRGNDPRFHPRSAIDGDPATYWATDDEVLAGELLLELPEARLCDRIVLEEVLPLGQRVQRFALEGRTDGVWSTLAEGTTVGRRRILRIAPRRLAAVRLRVLEARACPAIATVGLYLSPPTVAIAGSEEVFLDQTRVRLIAQPLEAEIRYTLDGSMPDLSSPLYDGPIVLKESTVVTALAFMADELGLQPAVRRFERLALEALEPSESPPEDLLPGLRWECFEGGWQSLDDLPARDPVASGRAATIDLDPRTRSEHVALRFEGWLDVPTDGVYTFYSASDDGSRLFLGDALVVDNDGLHGRREVSAQVGLRAGRHRIQAAWFNAVGGAEWDLHWKGPGFRRQPIAAERLSSTAPSED